VLIVAIVLGWPAVVASIILALAGIVRGRARAVLIGAMLGCPFLLYLAASPRIGWLAIVVGVLYLGSSWAVARSRRGLALAMAMPFIGLAGFVARLVLNR
jgi:hypothetical protein